METHQKADRSKSRLAVISIGMVIILIVLAANVIIFKNYEENITALQEENLLTIAKTVAGSLHAHYEDCLVHFRTYFDAAESAAEAVDFFEAQQDAISALYVLSDQGHILQHRGQDYDSLIPLVFDPTMKRASWLPPVKAEENRLLQVLTQAAILDGVPCYVLAFMETETVYNQIVKPIQVGASGYSMVKDNDGMILMHRAKNQIGLDAIQGRLELYRDRDLDLHDLEAWVNEQKNGAEGARLLHSYWWDNPDVPASEKLVAFTKTTIGDDIWVVNSTLDYTEIKAPIDKTRNLVALVTALLAFLFAGLTYLTVNSINRAKTMRMELNHLQELEKSNERLRHNEKISTLGAMTSMIAHEFNNYLTPIQLYSELILNHHTQGEAIQGYAAEILEAAQGAGELTRELSLYGRRDSEEKTETIAVKTQLEHSMTFIRKMLPDNIVLSVDLQGDNPFIRVRRSVINQIMVNLCTNAIHAMDKTGGLLRIQSNVETEEFQSYYHIAVIDTGHGMTQEVLAQIFAPFYTTKEAGTGTGLGLSIIRDIIQQAGGSITAQSKIGEGSRFDIKLPLYSQST